MKNTIMICAGGTGGHMFPALALAQDLISRDYTVVIVTDKRAVKFARGQESDHLIIRVIHSATLPRGIMGKIKGGLALLRGYLQSRRLISKYKPGLVIGFGGYPSMPPMVAAQQKNILTVIHEQNAVLGRANAYLAPKADRIALSLPDMSSLEEADAVRAVVTGNPIRSDIAALYAHPYITPDDDTPFHITVTGGSLGAKVMADIVPQALAKLPDEMKNRLKVTQQCNDDVIDGVKKTYKKAGIDCDLRPFINDMPEVLKHTSLIIARSGASTVAEIAVAGVPAIYIPYPHHADQQQRVNAEVIAKAGGAWVMEEKNLTPDTLAAKVEELMSAPEMLFNAAEAARSCAKPEAARKLGNLVIALLKGWNKDTQKPYDYTQGLRG